MKKVILLTGATDGIGFEAAKMLLSQGHQVLLHGRNADKLSATSQKLQTETDVSSVNIESYVADLSSLAEVKELASEVSKKHTILDVLINNAGVFHTSNPITESGIDVRFMVNTVAPYLLTKKLLPLFNSSGRIINLASAAQQPVNLAALAGNIQLSDNEAYAQSKLAIIMWTRALAHSLQESRQDSKPSVIALNPKSFLATKMVKQAYNVEGSDLTVGADIIYRAALSDEFQNANGLYFDNDIGQFSEPHPDALDPRKTSELLNAIEQLIA